MQMRRVIGLAALVSCKVSRQQLALCVSVCLNAGTLSLQLQEQQRCIQNDQRSGPMSQANSIVEQADLEEIIAAGLLPRILGNLCSPYDIVRCGAVCRSWQRALKDVTTTYLRIRPAVLDYSFCRGPDVGYLIS